MARASVSTDGQPQHTVDSVKGKAADTLLSHAWPVLPWLGMIPVAEILHHNWASGWTPAGCLLSGACLSALELHHAHGQTWVARYLPAVTVLSASAWLAAADVSGVTHSLSGIWFVGGLSVAIAWMRRNGGRGHRGTDISISLEGAHEAAGLKGVRVRSMQIWPNKRTGTLQLPGGKLTAGDVSKATERIEGAAGLPPGSLIVAPNQDHAGRADFTLSDPRTLRNGFAWQGPSAPGKSIAEPLIVGKRQDGEPTSYRIVGHHVQQMGMTGAGKSTGGAWNEIAEAVTRHDHAEFGIDVTKGRQFLGPLEPALHGLITEPDQIREFFRDVHRCVKDRADFLAERGHAKWVEGCGLTHLGFQMEEAPDIIRLLEDADDDAFEEWLSDIKAFRSAGGRWKVSLQRSDFTQLPTLVRGQMAKQCFGVESSTDADFGLSPIQKDRDCRPELWQSSWPGMFFLDAPTIQDKYKAMPNRGWYWGEETGPDSLIAKHAMQYPASARRLDPVTHAHLGKYLPAVAYPPRGDVQDRAPGRETVHLVPPPRDQEDDMGVVWEADPDPDDEDVSGVRIEYDPESLAAKFTGGGDDPPAEKMSADQAWAVFESRLGELAERGGTVTFDDVIDLADKTGHARTWLYWAMDRAVDRGALRRVKDRPAEWEFARAA